MPQWRSKIPSMTTKARHSQKKKRSRRQKVEVLDFMFPLGMRVCSVSKLCPSFCYPWILACQASLPMGFSRQECWCGLPFPPPGDLADRAWVSCISSIGRQILYHWATREALPTWQHSSDLWLMLCLSSNRSCSKLLKMEMTRKVKCQALFYQVK